MTSYTGRAYPFFGLQEPFVPRKFVSLSALVDLINDGDALGVGGALLAPQLGFDEPILRRVKPVDPYMSP